MEGQAGAAGCGEGFHSWMALNDNKAGMEGLDRDKINKIIMETSKGSKFYENELKKEQQVDQRIERMLQQKAQISEQQLRKAQAQVEKMAADLERGRDLGRVIVHVDMDAFYAAVEMRDCPELKDKPMAVGSKGMLSTSNYHARRFGVRAAMPGFIAKKLCPGLVIVQHNFEKYRAVSAEVREVFADYDPHFLPVSLDEAYLDITEHLRQRRGWPESLRTHPVRAEDAAAAADGEGVQSQGDSDADSLSPVLFEDSPTSPPDPPRGAVVFGTDAEEAVREMRFRIEQRTTLTASAGIAPNMMLAKVCSDKNKPNGQYRIPAERQAVMDFIQDLPIRKVSGIGKVTERMLRALEITTCSELRQKVALLSLLFSEVSWHHFLQISLGLGSTHIERDNERKSMSTERTFGEMSSAEEQYDLCRELCRDLAQDLQKEDLKGKTVTVKLKNVNFEVKTRASTVSSVVSSEEEIFAVAKDLLKTEIDNASPHPLRLRLMGVRVSGFVSCEDRKSLQKSIIGFLQSGRSAGDPPNPPKGAPDEQGVPPNPLHGGASKQAGAPPTVTQESKASPVKWGELPRIPGRPTEEGQQSFFQRAQALRLRREAGQGDPRDPGDSASSSSSSYCPSSSLQPSAPAGPGELFTCPVCFREQEGTDLRSFNRHVDECLSAGYAQRHGTGADGGPGTGAGMAGAGAGRTGPGAGRTGAGASIGGEEHCSRDEQMQSKAPAAVYGTGRGAGSRACQKASEKSRASPAPASDTLPRTSGTYAQNGLGPKPVESSRTGRPSHFLFSGEEESNMDTGCSEESLGDRLTGRGSEAPGRAGSSGGSGGPTLTCPVCNKKQDTRDLAVFNRHVDVCLNQDVLQELGEGPLSHSANVTATAWGKGKPENGHSPTKPSGKNKRHGSPHLPAPKKAKVLVPGNTIDRFFR